MPRRSNFGEAKVTKSREKCQILEQRKQRSPQMIYCFFHLNFGVLYFFCIFALSFGGNGLSAMPIRETRKAFFAFILTIKIWKILQRDEDYKDAHVLVYTYGMLPRCCSICSTAWDFCFFFIFAEVFQSPMVDESRTKAHALSAPLCFMLCWSLGSD